MGASLDTKSVRTVAGTMVQLADYGAIVPFFEVPNNEQVITGKTDDVEARAYYLGPSPAPVTQPYARQADISFTPPDWITTIPIGSYGALTIELRMPSEIIAEVGMQDPADWSYTVDVSTILTSALTPTVSYIAGSSRYPYVVRMVLVGLLGAAVTTTDKVKVSLKFATTSLEPSEKASVYTWIEWAFTEMGAANSQPTVSLHPKSPPPLREMARSCSESSWDECGE